MKDLPPSLPVFDLSPWLKSRENNPDLSPVMQGLATRLHQACRDIGFFYITGHGVSLEIQDRLDQVSQKFFALPLHQKLAISMDLGGRAWRGFFPVGQELTSGKPDIKEGIYFGTELDATHPKVQMKTPFHGPNLFPEITDFKATVLEYMDQVTTLGHHIMELLSLSLGLPSHYFYDHHTSDPLILFRMFHYPPDPHKPDLKTPRWGVGEHTDYGLLTILRQDQVGGLQVKSKGTWIEAPPIKNSFVCNIGDMLERMTGGLYLSTPHRVQNRTNQDRFSYPLFFDPGFDTLVKPVLPPSREDPQGRWDQASVYDAQGTYGQYLMEKVSKVFPDLAASKLEKK